jgi:hypothetical protein
LHNGGKIVAISVTCLAVYDDGSALEDGRARGVIEI